MALAGGAGMGLFDSLKTRGFAMRDVPYAPAGPRWGSWKVKCYPDKRAYAVDHAMQGGGATSRDMAYGFARFVVFFCSWNIFYFSNGRRDRDHSGPLRKSLLNAAQGPDPDAWEWVEWDLYRDPAWRTEGDLFRGGLSFSDTLGGRAEGRDESRLEAPRGMVARSTRPLFQPPEERRGGPQPEIVRDAMLGLLRWHDEFGPPVSIDEARVRAAHTFSQSVARHDR